MKLKMNTGTLDIVLILPGLASLTMMADGATEKTDLLILSPVLQAAILAVATIIIGSLSEIGSNIDRKCTEDYLYQLIANAALIGVMTCVLVNMCWLMAMLFFSLPDLTGQNMTGVTMLAWVSGYYWLRFRGLRS